MTQALFNYVVEQSEVPITSTSETSETSNPFEPVIDKLSESIKLISKVVDMPPKETSDECDSSKPINEVSSAILLSKAQREKRLRKKAVELEKDPDVFVTITEKDRLDSIAFCDRIETDSQMCRYAKEMEEDSKEHIDMTVRERLIGEEIIRHSLKDDGVITL